MTPTRTILVSAAVGLAALVTLDSAVPAQAEGASAARPASAHVAMSLGGDRDGTAAKRCRWVKTIGLVCDTELSTVNL
jgi:hypothetical protein